MGRRESWRSEWMCRECRWMEEEGLHMDGVKVEGVEVEVLRRRE